MDVTAIGTVLAGQKWGCFFAVLRVQLVVAESYKTSLCGGGNIRWDGWDLYHAAAAKMQRVKLYLQTYAGRRFS